MRDPVVVPVIQGVVALLPDDGRGREGADVAHQVGVVVQGLGDAGAGDVDVGLELHLQADGAPLPGAHPVVGVANVVTWIVSI